MLKIIRLCFKINKGFYYFNRGLHSDSPELLKRIDFKFKKCLIVSKLTRLDYEKLIHSELNDSQLESHLRNRGIDYDLIKTRFFANQQFQDEVVSELKKNGIETIVANRFNCTNDLIEWADILIPVGGDGTFLLAASKINNCDKPVVGFNSDPVTSEGFLCLPKQYTNNVSQAIQKLQAGEFKWLMRNRIRTTLIGKNINTTPKDLHDGKSIEDNQQISGDNKYIIPTLALNEIFIGETLSARVSTLEMLINESDLKTKLKCSGLCVSTGTGSTSWNLSINRITSESVSELLKLLNYSSKQIERLSKELSDAYNKKLIFSPDANVMLYTVRDLISAGVWPCPKGLKSRDYVEKLRITSRCYDASLIIDGGVSYEFNDGIEAILEFKPEDALRTIVLWDN